MSKLIVGNLKSNMSMDEIADYILILSSNIYVDKEIVICPSFVHIPFFINEHFKIASQDVSKFEKGSYTGEVSAEQLRELKVKYSIIGHSERKKLFNESIDTINKKIVQCLNNNISPIICVGETKEDKIRLQTEQVIRRYLIEILKDIDRDLMKNIIIAYEPTWSIGTGIISTPSEIDEIASYIKDIVKSAFKIDVKVLYGGSIDSDNIKKFRNLKYVDGFLVGSSSNNPVEFINIIKQID